MDYIWLVDGGIRFEFRFFDVELVFYLLMYIVLICKWDFLFLEVEIKILGGFNCEVFDFNFIEDYEEKFLGRWKVRGNLYNIS